METEGNLLQKMKNVFSDNEDKEKIAEEIIEKVLEGYEKGVLTRRETNPDSRFMKKILTTLWGFFISGMRCRATWTVRQGKNRCMI